MSPTVSKKAMIGVTIHYFSFLNILFVSIHGLQYDDNNNMWLIKILQIYLLIYN
jgi:hypothetical protein